MLNKDLCHLLVGEVREFAHFRPLFDFGKLISLICKFVVIMIMIIKTLMFIHVLTLMLTLLLVLMLTLLFVLMLTLTIVIVARL